MRVYLPATESALRVLVERSELAPAPLTGFAVTAGLREWYVDDNLEELEYAATLEAARASLRLLDDDADAARRRVVVVAEVPDEWVTVRDDLDRGVVQIGRPVPLELVESAHVDGPEAGQAVAAAASAIIAADLGDADSQDTVDDAEGFELGWYARQEIAPLLELL